jgi:hypothetical protein
VTVTRTLKHPITMFVVTVLIAIGIGVGFVGGLTYPQVPPRTYGHPPYAFSATFPSVALGGRLTMGCLDKSVGCHGAPIFVDWYTQAPNDGYYAWVFWIDAVTASGARLAKLDLPQGYRTHAVTRQGVTYLVGDPTCHQVGFLAPGFCSDVVVVKKGDITWIAGAASKTWPTLPKAFVQSFRVGA